MPGRHDYRPAPAVAAYRHAVHIEGALVNRVIYIVGLIVVVVAILSFFGLR